MALAHYTAGNLHLPREFRIVPHQAETIGRVDDMERVAFGDPVPDQDFPGQGHAQRVADGAGPTGRARCSVSIARIS